MKKILTILIIVVVVGALGYMGITSKSHFEHHGVMDKIHHFSGSEISADAFFDTTQFIKVHAQLAGIPPFYTPYRTSEITSFPCSNCHSVPLEQMQNIEGKSTQKAHWEVSMMHAGTQVMNCMTCHNQDDLNTLVSLSGEAISIDKSFDLCRQCHSTQFKDWQGGAHGKSINGWGSPRAIKTCVDCHNPHQPAFEKRWPAILNKQEKLGSK